MVDWLVGWLVKCSLACSSYSLDSLGSVQIMVQHRTSKFVQHKHNCRRFPLPASASPLLAGVVYWKMRELVHVLTLTWLQGPEPEPQRATELKWAWAKCANVYGWFWGELCRFLVGSDLFKSEGI